MLNDVCVCVLSFCVCWQSEAQQRKLSDQYQGLIHDKDEAIQELARTEEALRRQLDHRSQNEQELRQEKEMLLKVGHNPFHLPTHLHTCPTTPLLLDPLPLG